MKENLEKWRSCRFSVVLGYRDESGYATRSEGYIESYCCEQSNVVATGADIYRKSYYRDVNGFSDVVVFHETGKPEDPRVWKALEICRDCQLFQQKSPEHEKCRWSLSIVFEFAVVNGLAEVNGLDLTEHVRECRYCKEGAREILDRQRFPSEGQRKLLNVVRY